MYRKKSKDELPLPFGLSLFIGLIIYLKTENITESIYIAAISLILMSAAYFTYIYIKSQKKREKYLKSGIDLVDKMTGEEFELFLAAHFQRLGYKADTTSRTNDYGADLILSKDTQKIVVQAKRWSSKVGIEAVQQILGAKEYYKASKCMVVTNNYFTPNAENLASTSNVELWNRKKLLEVMSAANGREIISEITNIQEVNKRVICNRCGADMVLRNGKKGSFYGCSKFPKCRNTKSIDT